MPSVPVSLRPADAADCEFAYEVACKAIRPYAEQTFGLWDEARVRQMLTGNIDAGITRIIVAGSTPAGFLCVDEREDHIRLDQLFLLPAHQRSGIGTGLVQGVLARALQRQVPVRLRVLRVNPARRLYERLGFVVTAEEPERFYMQWTPPTAERRMQPLPLHTRSLVLRHFVPEDAPALLRLNAEPTTRLALPSHVYADVPEAVSATRYLIDCYTTPGDPRRGPYVLGVELRERAELLGHVGFSPLDEEVEISYAIAEAARGAGLGVEALVAACSWAAATFGLDRIVAMTAASNRPSRRTLDRAVFAHQGDEMRRFQGREIEVSRYVWSPPASATG